MKWNYIGKKVLRLDKVSELCNVFNLFTMMMTMMNFANTQRATCCDRRKFFVHVYKTEMKWKNIYIKKLYGTRKRKCKKRIKFTESLSSMEMERTRNKIFKRTNNKGIRRFVMGDDKNGMEMERWKMKEKSLKCFWHYIYVRITSTSYGVCHLWHQAIKTNKEEKRK